MLVAKPVVAPRLFAVLAGRPPGHPELRQVTSRRARVCVGERRGGELDTGSQTGLDLKRYVEQYARFQRPFNSCASVGAPCASSRRATSFTASFGRLSNCWPRAVRETASSSSFLRLSLSSTRGTSITSGAASSAESDGQSPSPSAIDCSGGRCIAGASCGARKPLVVAAAVINATRTCVAAIL